MTEPQHLIFLRAAYGRRYHTKQQALEAWNDGKDFITHMGSYCSIRDIALLRTNYTGVYILHDRGNFEV